MDCPFCPTCQHHADRPRARVSVWAPLALIVAVLLTAALASSMTESRESPARIIAAQGRAL
jgi:hypothetical protein